MTTVADLDQGGGRLNWWRERLGRLIAWLSAEDLDGGGPARGSIVADMGRRVVSVVRAHPLVVDATLAGVVLAISVVRGALITGGRAATPAAWALQVGLVVPLLWRRRYPIPAFAVVCAVAFFQWLYAEPFVADLAILISLYSVATRAPRRIAAAAAATVEVGVVLAAAHHLVGGSWVKSVVLLSGMVAAAFFLGTNVRTRKAYTAALVERARRLEYERDQQARIAVAAERTSIAREMHDIVAHSLAVIITLTEAAIAKRRSDPERAEAIVEQVSETARQALGDTRGLLGVLRTDPAADRYNPQPGLAQLDALLDQVRATGLAAKLTVAGQRFSIPDGAELAIYRIIQEALTNAIKHAAGASQVDVYVRYAVPVVSVDIVDNGHPQSDTTATATGGHGLIGMRERAALYNGTVTAGPGPGGGWSVRARIDLGQRSRPGEP